MWQCPDCGRKFKNRNQDHSCFVVPVSDHLNGKSANVVSAYRKLEDFVKSLPGVTVIPVKGAILFQAGSNFLAVKPKKTRLDIEFVLPEPSDVFPVYKVVQATKTKWAHFVSLEHPEEVDSQLKEWLRAARKCSL